MPLHTTDPKLVDTKIKSFRDHTNQFHFVTDFDGTLNHYHDSEGNKSQSIISLLYNNNILDEDYSKQAQDLYTHYVKIEHDTDLPLESRQIAMVERWTRHKELLMNKGLQYRHLEQITSLDRIVMRSGTDIFLKKLYELNIPVIIFSASGVGVDSIQLLLKHRGLNLPNIFIISNKLYRDEKGAMIGYSKPVIHSLNKTESVIRENPEYQNIQQQIKDKPHAIVIGDGLHDAEMVDKKNGRILISIGLCNDKVEEKIKKYSDTFDIVITHDDGFEETIERLGL